MTTAHSIPPVPLRLLPAKGLQIEEAPLTDKSVPVQKNTGPVALEVPPAEHRCAAYSDTLLRWYLIRFSLSMIR